MMRAPDRWAVAVRRADQSVSLYVRAQAALSKTYRWARWPLVRGNVALYESISLGWNGLQISANIAMEDAQPQQEGKASASHGSSHWMIVLSGLIAAVVAIGLFVLFPTWAADWLGAGKQAGPLASNAIEGAARLAVIIAYIGGVGLMPDIRRVFQYHGAEHATINCYEAGEPVTPDNVLRFSVLHPRCGTSFLLLVVVVKLVVNVFLGWPVLWQRLLLRIAVLPLVAALAYEVLYFAGRHRDSLFARAIAVPGMAMEALTTRRPSRDQAEVAIHALAAVAPDVELPEGMEPAKLWQPPAPQEPEPSEGGQRAQGEAASTGQEPTETGANAGLSQAQQTDANAATKLEQASTSVPASSADGTAEAEEPADAEPSEIGPSDPGDT